MTVHNFPVQYYDVQGKNVSYPLTNDFKALLPQTNQMEYSQAPQVLTVPYSLVVPPMFQQVPTTVQQVPQYITPPPSPGLMPMTNVVMPMGKQLMVPLTEQLVCPPLDQVMVSCPLVGSNNTSPMHGSVSPPRSEQQFSRSPSPIMISTTQGPVPPLNLNQTGPVPPLNLNLNQSVPPLNLPSPLLCNQTSPMTNLVPPVSLSAPNSPHLMPSSSPHLMPPSSPNFLSSSPQMTAPSSPNMMNVVPSTLTLPPPVMNHSVPNSFEAFLQNGGKPDISQCEVLYELPVIRHQEDVRSMGQKYGGEVADGMRAVLGLDVWYLFVVVNAEGKNMTIRWMVHPETCNFPALVKMTNRKDFQNRLKCVLASVGNGSFNKHLHGSKQLTIIKKGWDLFHELFPALLSYNGEKQRLSRVPEENEFDEGPVEDLFRVSVAPSGMALRGETVIGAHFRGGDVLKVDQFIEQVKAVTGTIMRATMIPSMKGKTQYKGWSIYIDTGSVEFVNQIIQNCKGCDFERAEFFTAVDKYNHKSL